MKLINHSYKLFCFLFFASFAFQICSAPDGSSASSETHSSQSVLVPSFLSKAKSYALPCALTGVGIYFAYKVWNYLSHPPKVTNIISNYQVMQPETLQKIIQLLAEHQALATSVAAASNKNDQFQNSGARIYLPGEVTTTLDDVIGGKRIKGDVEDVLYFLQHPDEYAEFGIKVPKGLIFSGPPGCGKTLIAKALAGQADAPFLYISGSEFSQMYVGVGAARVKNLFEQARDLAAEYGSCLIFIDEIDVLGHRRNYGVSGGDSEHAQTLNQLLSCMDGFDEHEDPIIVIGATNRFDVLDEALLRPGRFDKKVSFDLPRYKERLALFNHYFAKLARVGDINIELLARVTRSCNAAEIANLVNESAQIAFNEAVQQGISIEDAQVEGRHVEEAFDNEVLGKVWGDAVAIPESELYVTAVHEAGHAVMCALLMPQNPVYKVSIQPRGATLGVTHYLPALEGYNAQKQDFFHRIIMALGGSVAEEVLLGVNSPGKSNDLQKARQIVMDMLLQFGMSETSIDISFAHIRSLQDLSEYAHKEIEVEAQALISQARVQCQELMVQYKGAVEHIAKLLLDKELISGVEVYKACGLSVPDIIQNFEL